MTHTTELDRLEPAVDLGKRLPTGVGFAASVQPVGAQTVSTDATGLTAGEVTVTVGDFEMPAYRAMPEGGRDLPVVIVVSEIFGVHEYIADVARRFAQLGYLAIAPEFFVRQGDAKAPVDIATVIADVVSKVPDAQAMGDLDAAVAWAVTHGGDANRVGVTGFCWGGRITWLYAAHSAAVKAGVAWYGHMLGQPTALKPRHPVDFVGEMKVPVLGLYGEADPSIPGPEIEQMRAALAHGSAAAEASRLVVYPVAGHGFHADYRPGYDAASAKDGWQCCLDWLKAHGVA